MVEVKPMPYIEKYARVLGGLKHDEYVPGSSKRAGPGGCGRISQTARRRHAAHPRGRIG